MICNESHCTIIIATLALRERAESLRKAIQSIVGDESCRSRVSVVINGNRYDPALVAELQARTDVDVLQIPTPSLAAAILAGRQAVRTPYFGFLDDDDEYLPGAVSLRLKALISQPDAGLVVSNGYRHVLAQDRVVMRYMNDVARDPLAALFRENWLASCGGLFRARDVPPELFADIPRYLEWTWLAFRLASKGTRVAVLDQPTFRIHDTAGSESKSVDYLLCQAEILLRMRKQVTRPDVASMLDARLSQIWHDISNHHLVNAAPGAAWRAHLQSLRTPYGWRFLAYTRKLLFPAALIKGR